MRACLTRAALAGLLLAALSMPVLAGASNGPYRRRVTVQGFQSATLRVAFQPGRSATVVVEGDGDTPLAVIVLDARGRRVAADSRNPDRPSVRFTPGAGQGPYQIKVLNRGGVPNRVSVRTN